jgi:hypothetical protein
MMDDDDDDDCGCGQRCRSPLERLAAREFQKVGVSERAYTTIYHDISPNKFKWQL